jgi:LPXTG-motif cell wall-anchored protein
VQGKEITLSEPILMLFIGIVLLGMGVYARRKFKNSIE